MSPSAEINRLWHQVRDYRPDHPPAGSAHRIAFDEITRLGRAADAAGDHVSWLLSIAIIARANEAADHRRRGLEDVIIDLNLLAEESLP